MFRAFILPVILMGFVGIPILYSHHQRHTAQMPNAIVPNAPNAGLNAAPWQPASYQPSNINFSIGVPTGTAAPLSNAEQPSATVTPAMSAPIAQARPVFQPASQPTGFPQPVVTNSTSPPTVQPPLNLSQASSIPNANVRATPTAFSMTDNQAWAQPGMVPDFAKTETIVFPGDVNGPDLSAEPMSFTPTIDLASLFRFDITKQWSTSRWDRVSTCPADQGLHGMRVALVTGTNSWDLHGSLTYYFDANHRVQRITYRGWTGDASRLVQTLQTQIQLRPQPTHWAGLYLSKRSGLLMKHPAVIDKSNPVQQLALIMEINNPSGKTPLSNDFQSLLPAAMATQ